MNIKELITQKVENYFEDYKSFIKKPIYSKENYIKVVSGILNEVHDKTKTSFSEFADDIYDMDDPSWIWFPANDNEKVLLEVILNNCGYSRNNYDVRYELHSYISEIIEELT